MRTLSEFSTYATRQRARVAAAVVAAVVCGLAGPTRASAANVVPNPGFEQACGERFFPDICGWTLDAWPGRFMYADTTNPHSGAVSMTLGWSGETGGEYGGWGSTAATDPAFCAPVGPGPHPASVWDRDAWASDPPSWVSLGVTFYHGANCTGAATWDQFGVESDAPPGAWQHATGDLIAPPGTASALVTLSVGVQCANYSGCSVSANFDDIEIDDALLSTPGIGSFTPTCGPDGVIVDIRGCAHAGSPETREES
jgi:hypothetical protein